MATSWVDEGILGTGTLRPEEQYDPQHLATELARGGDEQGTEDHSFDVLFENSSAACAAALAIQHRPAAPAGPLTVTGPSPQDPPRAGRYIEQ
jgi:hypothetical protein